MEDKLKRIGKQLLDGRQSVTLGQGTENFGNEDDGDFNVAEVSEECNK